MANPKHKIKISNNITNLQVIGDSEYPNALQDNLISVELGDQCKEIGPSCFMNCKNLEYVKLPTACRYIGDYAFYGCENLKYITCLDKDSCYEIFSYGSHAFDGCNSLEDIYFKLSSTVSRDATVGEYCFANCQNLKTFNQKGWSYLGSHMFSGCEQLTAINLQNNTNYVQSYALADIPNIKSITIPNKLWIISEGMFAGDKNLTSVTVNDGSSAENKSVLMQIGDSAFASCDSLSSIVLPQSINDISCCDNFMLKDSSISAVTFNGIPDKQFVIADDIKLPLANDYIRTNDQFQKLSQIAADRNIPMIIFTNHYDYTKIDTNCAYCEKLASQLRTSQWKLFMEQNYDKYLFFYAQYSNNSNFHKSLSKSFTTYKITINWSDANMYAKAAIVWRKPDGSIFIKQTSGYAWGSKNDATTLIKNIEEATSGAKPGTTYDLTYNINQNITKLGSPLAKVTYISKEGNTHIVTKDTYIETIPNTRVDAATKDNFKYGTWYYNAEALRAFADKNGIPVLCEYSKDGCSPCMYFKKNVFKNSDFQNWVMDSPYLFCRIEIEENDNFNNKFKNAAAYYVDKVWAKELDPEVHKKSIPIFFWYWNQNGTRLVGDLSSYHFNPDSAGAKPPFSMEELIQQTDSKFRNYLSSPDFRRYQTYDLYSNAQDPVKIGLYADNVNEDVDGVMFPCDYKNQVTSYSTTFALSGYQTLTDIRCGQEVPYAPYTYYVYDVAASQSYSPDAFGVIFQVSADAGKNKITWIVETSNVPDTPYKPEQKYSTNRWYNLTSVTDATTFTGIIAEADDLDYRVIVLKTSDDKLFNEKVKDQDAFKSLLSDMTNTYFVEVRTTDWSSGLGEAFKKFQTADHNQVQADVHFPYWQEKTPLVFTYLRCINCSFDGKNAVPYVATQIDEPNTMTPAELAQKIQESFQTAAY